MTFFALCLLLVNGQVLAAQEPPAATHLYETYYTINMANLDQWNHLYQEESVPVLTELQHEGVVSTVQCNTSQERTGEVYAQETKEAEAV